MPPWTPLSGLDTNQIENIYLYISDATRWDLRPEELDELGPTIRTVANGLRTPAGRMSILTGCHPQNHGVHKFGDVLDETIDTVFDYADNTAFNDVLWGNQEFLFDVVSSYGYHLDSLNPPLIQVEHGHGAHAPYLKPDVDIEAKLAGYKEGSEEWISTYRECLDESAAESFRRLAGDQQRLKEEYATKLELDFQIFTSRIEELRERELIDSTLAIFTSDHGELLGEHGGFVGHTLPAAPELVYVPTTFIHPSLSPSVTESPIIDQADIATTVADVLGKSPSHQADGVSLLSRVDKDRFVPCIGYFDFPAGIVDNDTIESIASHFLNPAYYSESIWSANGGWIWNESNLLSRFVTGVYDATKSAETGQFNKGKNGIHIFNKLVRPHLHRSAKFGNPGIALSEAQEIFGTTIGQTDTRSLSNDAEKRLEQLGYK